MKPHHTARRDFLRIGGAILAVIPLVSASDFALASQNAAMRGSLKYQSKPNGDKSCAGCAQFVPGKSAGGAGSCKIITGDTEISPSGYCTAWTKKA